MGVADYVGRCATIFGKLGGVTETREGGGAKVAVRWRGVRGGGKGDHFDGTGRWMERMSLRERGVTGEAERII